ncbi:trypanothione synthetase-like protein [Novymonas esmeraldas]|uniref:Trypanothione synthetase-like protein n=1 Tax=Novymonas esmeraldas TaxID=1808958 RepID=A0AAW0F273_9TRYP
MTSDVTPAASLLPYGEHQGSFRGVVACSNRDDGYFSGENNYVNSLIYTGFRYQCVEYARRFLLLTTGCVFDNCGRASEIYAMDHLTHVETGERYTLHHHHNDGSATQAPAPGDIIIYPYHPELTPWGHVGIVSFVDDTRVGIAEQNQFFGPFTSPSESYLDGERCVARYATLIHDAAAKTWRIEEPSTMPRATGWMSYPDAPTREQIYAPLTPLPSAIKVRATPFDQPEHPYICHYHLHNGFDIPCGRVGHAYGMRSGAAETLVGATSAVARVLRFTLQFLFHRSRLGPTFRGLPTNPLKAVLPGGGAAAADGLCGDVDALFSVLADEDVIAATEATPDALRQALAKYFDIPVEWVAAMERDFAKGESHLAAAVTFYPNVATDADDVAAFHAAHTKARSTAAAPAIEAVSPTTANATSPVADQPDTATTPGTVEDIPLRNPHDESWCLGKVNFGSTRVMAELTQLNEVKEGLFDAVALMTPSIRSFMLTQYRMDFAAYLKTVETVYGARTAFTIVLSDDQPMDGLLRELVAIMQNLCERVKYPVRVVNEKDLTFVDGKLRATPTEASPEVASPTSSITPSGVYDVDFVYALCEWPRILANHGAEHPALYHAAIDPAADVVFAKPLWSHLCSGTINITGNASDAPQPHAAAPSMSIRFFEVCRRLYLLASPKQPSESWDLEVSEYKDSCRRIHIDAAAVPMNPPASLRADTVMINLAGSCFMGHVGGTLHPDPENTGAYDGHPASLSFLSPTD